MWSIIWKLISTLKKLLTNMKKSSTTNSFLLCSLIFQMFCLSSIFLINQIFLVKWFLLDINILDISVIYINLTFFLFFLLKKNVQRLLIRTQIYIQHKDFSSKNHFAKQNIGLPWFKSFLLRSYFNGKIPFSRIDHEMPPKLLRGV